MIGNGTVNESRGKYAGLAVRCTFPKTFVHSLALKTSQPVFLSALVFLLSHRTEYMLINERNSQDNIEQDTYTEGSISGHCHLSGAAPPSRDNCPGGWQV